MPQHQRDIIARNVAVELANELMRRLPADDRGRRSLLESGQVIVRKLGWDRVLEAKLIPMLRRVMANGGRETSRPAREQAVAAV